MARPTSSLHPRSALLGAVWTLVALLALDHFVGPGLVERSLSSPERRLLTAHRTLERHAVLAPDGDALSEAGARAMLEALDDPYAEFIGPDEVARFDRLSSGSYPGIGAYLIGDRIYFPLVGGPAERAGLLPGDRILAVDGVPVSELEPPLASHVKGPRGSEVVLDLERPDGERYRAEIRRRAVPAGSIGDLRWLDRDAGIAHVHLRSFTTVTPAELDRALEELAADARLRGLALDLRWNLGGQLDAAQAVAGRFLPGDALVCTLTDGDGRRSERRNGADDGPWSTLPVVLLVDSWSASGSEVLAGALQDHGAAVLVGTPTYGKGIFQQVYRFRDGAFLLKFTAGLYRTPSGRLLEGRLRPGLAGGLEPDVRIELDAEAEAAIRAHLQRSLPPLRYRELAARYFPERVLGEPPPDAQLDEALTLLRRALTP